MNAVLDLPPINTEPPAVEKTNAIAAGIASVQGEVAKFDQIAAGLAAIEAAHPKNVIVAAIETPAGMKQAETSWRAYRNPRLEVERARKAAKAPVLALGKAIDTFAGGLEDRLRAGEDHYKAQIDREEERRAAIKAEQERIEREAAERHAARRSAIAMYALRCQEPGMTAERIAAGMQRLEGADLTDADNARAVELADARCRTIDTMRTLHAQAVAREQEAARQEAIRIENERRAAELAEAERRIAAEAEALRRAAAELAAREAAAREAEARRAEQAAMTYPNGAAMFSEQIKENGDRVMLDPHGKRSIFCDVDEGTTEGQHPEQVLKAEPETADATDPGTAAAASPCVGTMGAGQAADAAPAADLLAREAQIHTAATQAMQAEAQLIDSAAPLPPAEPEAPAPDEPADVKMGTICRELGFNITEEFVRETLGVTPAARDKRAILFTATQRRQILLALVRHVQALIK